MDENTVLPILKTLKQNNINIWYDEGIEADSEWPEYIAQKIELCDRVICFISDAYPLSQNCSRELNFAIAEKKDVLSVFVSEKVSLPAGMRMQLGSYQSVFLNRYKSTQSFCESLCKEKFVNICAFADDNQKNNFLTEAVSNTKKTDNDNNNEKKKAALVRDAQKYSNKNSTKQKKKGSGVMRFFVFTLFCALLWVTGSRLLDAPFSIPQYKFAFIAAMIITVIACFISAFMIVADKDFKNLSNFSKRMIFLFSTVIEVLVNYYCCLLICQIPVWYELLAIASLIIINIIISIIMLFVEFLIVILLKDS